MPRPYGITCVLSISQGCDMSQRDRAAAPPLHPHTGPPWSHFKNCLVIVTYYDSNILYAIFEDALAL